MKVEGRRMTEIGEMISQRYCSGRDAGGHDAEERKARMHNSLNSEEIIRTGTRITQIGRIYTDGFQYNERKFVSSEVIMEDNFK
jgi:hypothetical protein